MNTRQRYVGFLAISALFFTNCTKEDDTALPEPPTYSPYITSVFDFQPAVGQFTNSLPAYSPGDTHATMIAKASKALINSKNGMISLGGFGGFVVFGFDHTIENKPGLMDFRILGNSFLATSDSGTEGGSSEPGVILVSYDANQNGLPDDPWYEIAGSAHADAIPNYQITYHKPDPNQTPTPGDWEWELDTSYIKWTDNQGNTGYISKNSFHSQSYFPEWITESSLTFTGTLLPPNILNEGTAQDPLWVSYPFEWGYADNYPNADDRAAIDIDWAVDQNGQPAHLKGIDFIKVYSGTHQQAGRLGESSTEISGAEDLHLLQKTISNTRK